MHQLVLPSPWAGVIGYLNTPLLFIVLTQQNEQQL